MKKSVYLFILVLISSNYFSQSEGNLIEKSKISVNLHKGLVLPHYEFIYANTKSGIQSIDFTYSKRLTKDSVWDKLYNFPEVAVSLFYTTLGNDDVFGREIALVPSFKMYLLETERLRLFSRIGFGISYTNKKFSYDNNIQNLAIGSSFNIHFDYRFGFSYNLKNRLLLSSGISFSHYSNANTVSPNLGLNYISLFGGVEYLFGETKIKSASRIDFSKSNNMYVYASIGARKIQKYTHPISLSFQFERKISWKYLLGGGIDVSYDSFVKDELLSNGEEFEEKDLFYSGLFLLQSMEYNRFKFSLQEGVYLFLKNKLKRKPYFRVMINYKMTEKLSVRLAVKTHLFVADYPELGIGIKL